ncbi:MAG: phosphatidylglycerophosphate synthase [Sphingobium sp.]|nr:MAG: phosphatidylglycerophosphate synthase [Sphingobium sp.]
MSGAGTIATDLGPLRTIGTNDTPIWGMPNAERMRRQANSAAKEKRQVADGHVLWTNLGFAYDPLLFRLALAKPGTVFTREGELVVGQLPAAGGDAPALSGPGIERIELSGGRKLYNEQLRKLEEPFVSPLTPTTRKMIERQSYFGAYKGVTDLLTKYLWPEFALVLTRIAAQLRMTPNMVSAIGIALCILAFFLFRDGLYWTGFLAGFIFMVLDTVDGKLARCTITSSYWGNIIDHGVDLVHPPFWWYAWGVGLAAHGLSLAPSAFALVMAAVIIGYIVQRLIEGAFIRSFGMHIHVWQRFDTQFRLITARRNPNMVLLFVSLLIGRPDLGLIWLAWWTVLSCAIHAVRLVQAYIWRSRHGPLTSWLTA